MAKFPAVAKLNIQLEDFGRWIGQEVALSDWLSITQERIDRFAEAVEDRQWIHVDRERAARESPFGATIAHGFLTLAVISHLFDESVAVEGRRMGINYGFNRLRFTDPVPAGARVRARFVLVAVERIDGGAQTTWAVTVEREAATKPALVAEWLTRHYC